MNLIQMLEQKTKLDKKMLIIVGIGILGMVILLLTEVLDNKSEISDLTSTKTVIQSQSDSLSETEMKLTEFINLIDGVGRAKVIVMTDEKNETINGVAVVCEGADSASVRENIIDSLIAVLNIKSSDISITKMGKQVLE